MRKTEKETLQIINSYKSDEYNHMKKLVDMREKEIKNIIEEKLKQYVNIDKIRRDIENFKALNEFKVSVNFDLCIREYYTDYQYLFDKDNTIKELKLKMHNIELERNKMILILQNNEIKSDEYKKVIKTLKKGE